MVPGLIGNHGLNVQLLVPMGHKHVQDDVTLIQGIQKEAIVVALTMKLNHVTKDNVQVKYCQVHLIL